MVERIPHRALQFAIADDNPTDVAILRYALSQTGIPCDLRCFPHSKSFLGYLQQCLESQQPWPDVLILDRNLSGEDSLSLYRTLKAQAHIPPIPTVMLSGVRSPEDLALAGQMGLPFWEKPMDLDEWVQIAHQIASHASTGSQSGSLSSLPPK